MADAPPARPEPLVLPEPFVSYGKRTSQLAEEHPDKVAIVFAPQRGDERHVTWRELDEKSTQMAHLLADRGVDHTSTVVIGLPNCVEHYFTSYGAWKLGACVLPMRWDLPDWERDRMLEIANAKVIVAGWQGVEQAGAVVSPKELNALDDWPTTPLPDVVPAVARAIGSGGSTGRPKIIRTPYPGAGVPGESMGALSERMGWGPRQVRLIAGPLYHMSPFVMSFAGLFEDQTLITMERFQADHALDLIERHRIEVGLFVPTMLYRMARVPGVEERDLSSLVAIFSGGAKLAPWVMRKWIDLIGAERIWEGYGATEAHGNTAIRGDEWLEHPGSTGKPFMTDLKILDPETGNELAPGEIGEIFMRPQGAEAPTFEYIGGAKENRTADGFASVGDLGWVDEDGYLFIADRRADMIISGGANIYPAEIEACLSEHPGVGDVAVIGLPDPDWGQAVHAVVQVSAGGPAPSEHELREFCRERLARYKVPKSVEFVEALPRNDIGKIQRSALITERAPS